MKLYAAFLLQRDKDEDKISLTDLRSSLLVFITVPISRQHRSLSLWKPTKQQCVCPSVTELRTTSKSARSSSAVFFK
jgi:hypothetical protein